MRTIVGTLSSVPCLYRQTGAFRLVQRGVQLAVEEDWRGHKGIATTTRYAHLAGANLKPAAYVLEAAS